MTIRRIVLAVLLLSGLALGQGTHVDLPHIYSQSSTPQPIPGLTITVCAIGAAGVPCSPTVSVFSDQALTLPISTLQTNGDGLFPFWISAGSYQYCAADPVLGRITTYCLPFTVSPAGGGPGSFTSGNFSSNVSVGGTLGVTGQETLTKASSSTATFMLRAVDSFGATNNQLIGFSLEQMLNPSTTPMSIMSFGQGTELFTPSTNTANFSGAQQAVYGSINHFGSGTSTAMYGGAFEAFNDGPSTATLMVGVNGTANNGGVAAGVPSQTPTNNGNATNLRAISGITKNSSSGTVTAAAVLYADTGQNTGGGVVTTQYGALIADQTAGATNFALFTGLGKTEFSADQVSIGAAPLAGSALTVFPTFLTGTSQFGVRSLPVCSSASTTQCAGFLGQARTAAVAFTVARAAAFSVSSANVGAGSAITKYMGLDCDSTGAITGGTTNYCVDQGPNPERFQETTAPSAVANSTILYADSTAHALEASYNGGSFGVIPLLNRAQTFTATQTFNTPPVAGGTAAGLTGTGACATFSTQSGGSWAGRATCTAATAASTLTITPGTTAPNGWMCNVQDQTTRANLLQQTSTNTTTCTLTATSVTQNDVFVFTAVAF